MASESPRGKLDLATGVIPITSIVVFVAATWWLSDRLHSIDTRLDHIEQVTVDRWTRTQMENWILRAQKSVPGLPDISGR